MPPGLQSLSLSVKAESHVSFAKTAVSLNKRKCQKASPAEWCRGGWGSRLRGDTTVADCDIRQAREENADSSKKKEVPADSLTQDMNPNPRV